MFENPRISSVGLSGVLVSFAADMQERANLAALAFRAAIDAQDWPDVIETASTLVSTFVAVDLTTTPYENIRVRLQDLLTTQDWEDAPLPQGRKLWTLPMCFEGSHAPQLGEAAHAAGLSEREAARDLQNARTRVITIGYAPGQPYLDAVWNIPRQSELTPHVPAGALVIAIRQFVLFTAAMPTGWRQVGQTAFRPFDPDRASPVVLAPGDEVRFAPITADELSSLQDGDSLGGAAWETLL